VLSTVDMVVQRRDGPHRRRDRDDDDDDDDETRLVCSTRVTLKEVIYSMLERA